MKLKNPFPTKNRELFRDYQYTCFYCSKNGSGEGGTSLHHIRSRISSSVFNGAVLCFKHHSKIGHSFEEESYLLKKTAKIVFREIKLGNYILDDEDKKFLYKNKKYYI